MNVLELTEQVMNMDEMVFLDGLVNVLMVLAVIAIIVSIIQAIAVGRVVRKGIRVVDKFLGEDDEI